MYFKNKNLTNSSKSWISRQKKDMFVSQAKNSGYRARSAYKLKEIELKYKILRNSKIIIDLGAAPGSWAQFTREITHEKCKVYAFDLLPMDEIFGVEFHQMDCLKLDTGILNITNQKKACTILSDISPNKTGDKTTDHFKIAEICWQVIEISKIILKDGGNLCFKITRGSEEQSIFNECKKYFAKTYRFKPISSRKESSEIYIIAKGFTSLTHER